MTPPEFDDLVEDEGTPEELDRLRRVHELLIAAGPPPELSPRLSEAPPVAAPTETSRSRVSFLPHRRRQAVALLAAAVLALAFGLGFLIGDRGDSDFDAQRAVPMHGVGATSSASASLLLGQTDAVGNVPLEMRIRGLKPLEGGWYTLWLTKDGKAIAPCGTFAVGKNGTTAVRFSVAYDLKRYDGWVIDAFFPAARRRTGVLLTT
jgi:hypothetical protein